MNVHDVTHCPQNVSDFIKTDQIKYNLQVLQYYDIITIITIIKIYLCFI